MNWFKQLFSKKEKESKPEPKLKTYDFVSCEAFCVGDHYKYTVTANSKEEAFKKLVKYFVESVGREDIESSSSIVSYPSRHVSFCIGMPEWFFNYLKGGATDYKGQGLPEQREKDRKTLEHYCITHGIKLKAW